MAKQIITEVMWITDEVFAVFQNEEEAAQCVILTGGDIRHLYQLLLEKNAQAAPGEGSHEGDDAVTVRLDDR